MRVDLFDYDLPREMIADRPVVPRDAARLLEVGDRFHDRKVWDLPDLLRPGDVLVVNDTRVIPARLFGRRGGRRDGRRGAARVEVTLHRRVADGTWRAFARPARRLSPGDEIAFAPDFSARVAGKGENGEVVLRFELADAALLAALERHGAMPLPPYIRRANGPDPRDRGDYQTVFAEKDGAVAAPTAALHFTPELLDAVARRGVRRVAVTLHVGAGTFLPVKADDTRDHALLAETGVITPAAAEAVNAARTAGGRVVAVGTTTLRLLESAADAAGTLHAFDGETALFVTPGYRFRIVDLLLTNFHLPRSTLFMLVCAFSGLARMRAAYDHAKAAGYRFYSYGDSCLLHRPAAQSLRAAGRADGP